MDKKPKILYLRYSSPVGGKVAEILNELSETYDCLTVNTREEYVMGLHEYQPDVVLVENGVYRISSNSALKLVQGLDAEIPFVFITSVEKEDDALELLQAGAADYILKDKTWKLPFVLENQLGKLNAKKQKEHELVEKSRLYEHNLAGVFTTHLDGKIRSCNMAFANMLGYATPEELVGSEIGSLYHMEEDLRHTSKMLLENGELRNFESAFLRKDGQQVRLLVNSYLLYDAVLGEEICEGVIIDYTDTAQVLSTLDQENMELTKRNRNLEQFTYVISHNLRAPLANLMSLTELLKDVETGGEAAQLIKGLNTSILTMHNVIKDLNHTLQVKQELNQRREKVYFQSLMDEIIVSINNLVLQEGVRVRYDFQIPSLLTVRGYIYSIFYNLTLNSIKYRREEEAPLIQVKSELENGMVKITFQDNGKGIDMQKNGDQLFGLYKRFDTSKEGKGMGLYMTKTQIEDLGGHVSVESQLGLGTKIFICLPIPELP